MEQHQFKFNRLIFDLETDGFLEDMTKIHCLVIYSPQHKKYFRFNDQIDQDDKTGSINDGIKMLEDAQEIIAHNLLGFDELSIRKIYPGFNPKGTLMDSAVISRLIWTDLTNQDYLKYKGQKFFPKTKKGGPNYGGHSLECWGYRLGLLKGNFGKLTDWKDWSKEMEEYCVVDVEILTKFVELIDRIKYSQEAIRLEHDFKRIIVKQELRGFAFDMEAAEKLYEKLSKRRVVLEREFQTIFPPKIQKMKTPQYWYVEYPNDTVQERYEALTKGALIKILKEEKRPPKNIKKGPVKIKEIPFKPTSADHIAARLIEKYNWKPTEFTDGGKPQITEDVLKTLDYPEAKPLQEFLMIQTRMSQLAEGDNSWLNLEKNGRMHGQVNTNGAVTGRCTHYKPNYNIPTVNAPYGHECRSLFTASRDMVLVGWDASGLELRCLAHFLAKWDNGRYIKLLLEGDIHTANQEAAGLETRDQAKTFIYAWLYGAGNAKIGKIIGKGAKAGEILKKKFLAAFPAIRSLKKAVDDRVEGRGYLLGIDGRKLHVRSAHSALNTLLQSAGGLVMKKAAVLQYESLVRSGLSWGKDFAFVANIHDELQIESRPEIAYRVGRSGVMAIQAAGKYFKFRCPLDGEYKIGKNWAETH